MRKEHSPFVIAIAGVSGSGKTAVTNQLQLKLNHSKGLYFDDYNFEGPNDIIQWVENGSDYDKWNLEPFLIDLKKLYEDDPDYIILDFPFAYKHSEMRSFIDLAVFIDTPLDIALVRRLKRDFATSSVEEALTEMDNYVSRGRKGYIEMLATIKPNSDIVIDGSQSISEITDKIIAKIYN